MKNNSIRFLTTSAAIAALYCALTLAIAPIAFGQIQFRVSELLTVLPLFSFAAVPGLTVGCLLSNLIGFLIGVNPIGMTDALFGTLATLLAAIAVYYIGKTTKTLPKLILAPFFPVLFNGVIIGLELTLVFASLDFPIFLAFAGSVALGELAVCYGLGIPFILLLQKKDAKGVSISRRIFKY